MCGRYTLRRLDLAAFGVRHPADLAAFEEFTARPRFNIAPSQPVPVVRLDPHGGRALAVARWGLIPGWAKAPPRARPVNARAETVATSGMFRDAFRRRRCLVPADGFYEWRRLPGGGGKRPVFVRFPDDRAFGFAGLWERWRPPPPDGPDGPDVAEPVDTCTIITTAANGLMAPIHDRMPVILSPADHARWLDPSADPREAAGLLRPYPDGELAAAPVDRLVNSPANDVPACVAPLAEG